MEKGLVFGLSIGELLTIYDHDSRSWKMSGCLFTGDYARSSAPLRKSGIMLNGRIYEQATWVLRTEGKESGLWPTPQARAQQDTPSERNRHTPCLETAVKWPTPQAIDSSGQGRAPRLKKDCNRDPNTPGSWRADLKDAVKMWPTPTTQEVEHPDAVLTERGRRLSKDGLVSHSLNLADVVKWPTPQSRDWKGKSQRGADPENRDCLPNAVMNFPTPQASDWKNKDFSRDTTLGNMKYITGESRAQANGGQLNAEFVEWLMNYPKGWTEMD